MLKKFVEPKSIKVMKYQKKVKQKKTVEELQAELTQSLEKVKKINKSLKQRR